MEQFTYQDLSPSNNKISERINLIVLDNNNSNISDSESDDNNAASEDEENFGVEDDLVGDDVSSEGS